MNPIDKIFLTFPDSSIVVDIKDEEHFAQGLINISKCEDVVDQHELLERDFAIVVVVKHSKHVIGNFLHIVFRILGKYLCQSLEAVTLVHSTRWMLFQP